MRIAQGRIVPLGYGKYVRSDRITAMEPLEEGRGPGRRTRVWVEGASSPLIASRSESAILSDAIEGTEDLSRANVQRALLVDLMDTVEALDPMIRRIVRDQSGWDLDRLERRVREVLGLDAG